MGGVMATVVTFLRRHSALVVLVPATLLLAAGVGFWLIDDPTGQRYTWGVAGLIGAAASLIAVVRGLVRRSSGVDVLALLAIVGALWLGEYLAAALIAVMIGTGNLLDQWAQSTAERELAALVARSPRRAFIVREGHLADVEVSEVTIGSVVQVPSGTIVTVDGRLQESATLDESALTGESDLVHRPSGDVVRSGVVNAGNAVQMIATATAENSTYADIVRLVQHAQASSAPYVRLADRLAWWFIPSSLAVAGLAWLLSGDPVRAEARGSRKGDRPTGRSR